jgi:hypothetical protein
MNTEHDGGMENNDGVKTVGRFGETARAAKRPCAAASTMVADIYVPHYLEIKPRMCENANNEIAHNELPLIPCYI